MDQKKRKIILCGGIDKNMFMISGGIDKISYSIAKQDRYEHDNAAFGTASATRIDDHYLLTERFNDTFIMPGSVDLTMTWTDHPEMTIGIVHTPQEANRILYDKMKKRAQQMAILDNRELVEKLSGLECLK
ncbi:MAG: hypothetical protein PHH54_03450 [Candidatus Nanoarchaeia archaeon]|nr:hypothetical protein [Candidatus Nanoarchaeia archaeon]MDD5741013.1 hypothetical protein [Candidatus Nanoarchaeia archaeon]